MYILDSLRATRGCNFQLPSLRLIGACKCTLIAAVAAIFCGTASASLSDGLIAWYPFEGTTLDAGPNENHGTAYGAVSYVPGVAGGQAARFSEGANPGYILTASDIPLNSPSYAVSAYFRVAANIGDWEIIASRMKNGSTSWEDAWDLTVNSSAYPIYWFFDTSQQAVGSTEPIRVGQWHSYVVNVSDGSGGVYIDGELVASFQQSVPISSEGTLQICIACNDYNPSSQKHYLNGDLDDLRFYGRSLSGVEIASLASAVITDPEPELPQILDFESPLPNGLVPMSFWNGTTVPPTARVTDQYLNHGIRIEGAALIALGSGHAASGLNGLGGIDASGRLNYDSPVTFSFFSPLDGTTPATTDYFAYSPDLGGGSQNVITITAYDLGGRMLGQVSYTETGTFPVSSPLSISGFGQFHRVTVDQTLYNSSSGGIGIDLVRFGALHYPSPDETPPVITPIITGTLGNGGWYTSAVTVSWIVEDDESVISTQSDCGWTQLTADSADSAGSALTCSATSDGGTSSSTVTIKIDSTWPTINCGVTPNVLWSPNHKLVDVAATVNVADALSKPNGFALVSVTSNEPDAGLNKSDVPIDTQGWALGTPDVYGQVRSERSDAGTGRVYTISYRGEDLAGNIARCNTTVSVPLNQKK